MATKHSIIHSLLDNQSAKCNHRPSELEKKACAHTLRISKVLNTYYNDFAVTTSAYNCAVEDIMQLRHEKKIVIPETERHASNDCNKAIVAWRTKAKVANSLPSSITAKLQRR